MSKYLLQIFITSHIKFIIYVTVIRNAKTCYKNYISKSSKHPNLTYCQNVQCTKLKAQVSSLHLIFKIKTILYFTLLYSIQRVVPKITYIRAINSLKNCKKKEHLNLARYRKTHKTEAEQADFFIAWNIEN